MNALWGQVSSPNVAQVLPPSSMHFHPVAHSSAQPCIQQGTISVVVLTVAGAHTPPATSSTSAWAAASRVMGNCSAQVPRPGQSSELVTLGQLGPPNHRPSLRKKNSYLVLAASCYPTALTLSDCYCQSTSMAVSAQHYTLLFMMLFLDT